MKPNLFSVLSILILALAIQSKAQTPQRDNRPRAASIGGQVSVGGRPAANVTVKVEEIVSRTNEFFVTSGTAAMRQPETFKVVTDAGGRYRLSGLAAGSYRVSAASNVYVLANQNSGVEPAKSVTLDGDESREDVDLSLARGGVITGRVTTSDGRPLIATRVWLYAALREGDQTGYNSHTDQLNQMFETDDRGVYRIYGLSPGRYILSAGGSESYLSSKDPARNYRRTYFRGAASWNKATTIEIKEGSEVIDVDLEIGALMKTYEASGRMVEADTETPVPEARIWAQGYGRGSGEDSGPRDADREMRLAGALTDSQGNFRLTDLTPGRYEVGYTDYGGDSRYHSDPVEFEIIDDNVAGLEIKARRAATISGMAVIEGAVDPNLRRLLFTPDAINVDTSYIVEMSRSSSRRPITEIQPNGEFRVSVSRGGNRWKVNFVANQLKVKGLRVSRVELNGVEAPDGIDATPGQRITGVRVVFTQAIGAIRGQLRFIGALPENVEPVVVVTPAQEGAASFGQVDSVVVVAEAPGQEGAASYRQVDSTEVVAGGKGRFIFDALVPGEYEVRAYLRSTTDGQVITGAGSPAQRVTVTNGQETPVELTIDPNKIDRRKER
jgi:protocatechuate 3,4-dioxygenase beta subunit